MAIVLRDSHTELVTLKDAARFVEAIGEIKYKPAITVRPV